MPDFGLSERDSADLAAYLQMNEQPVSQESLPQPEPALVRKGRSLFVAKGCASCHDAGEGFQLLQATPLIELRNQSSKGCLAEETATGRGSALFSSVNCSARLWSWRLGESKRSI